MLGLVLCVLSKKKVAFKNVIYVYANIVAINRV